MRIGGGFYSDEKLESKRIRDRVFRYWQAAGTWTIWLIGFILCLIFASNYGGVVPYTLVKIFLAIPFVGGLYCIWVVTHFRYYQNISSKTVIKNAPVDYSLIISNEDFLDYGNIRLVYHKNRARLIGLSEENCYSLAAGEKKEISTKICCKYRGEYEVGVSHIIVRDYLKLIRLRYVPISSFRVIVLPRVTKWCYEQEVFENSSGNNNTRTLSDGEMDVQVRNYETGDSLKRIHWKASAKTGKLMSREFCETRKNALLLMVDLRSRRDELDEESSLKYEDLMIEQMVSIVHTCLTKRIPCTIVFKEETWKKIEIMDMAQWRKFYNKAGKIIFNADESVVNGIKICTGLDTIRYAVFLTDEMSRELCTVLEDDFKQIKRSVVLVEPERTTLKFNQ